MFQYADPRAHARSGTGSLSKVARYAPTVTATPPQIVEVANAGVVDWVIAAATLLAALVPLILFLRERADRTAAVARAEEAEHRRWEAEERYRREELLRLKEVAQSQSQKARRSRAEPVFAWLEVNDAPHPAPSDLASCSVVFSNETRYPLKGVWLEGVEVFRPDGVDNGPGWEGQEQTRPVKFYWFIVPPTRGKPLKVPLFSILVNRPMLPPPGFTLHRFVILDLAFTDTTGVRWKRDLVTDELQETEKSTEGGGAVFQNYANAFVTLFDSGRSRQSEEASAAPD